MLPKLLHTHPQHSLLRQRWQSMELGLNDIKIALGTLKRAYATLETETEKLGNEMLAMKDIMDPLFRESSSAEGSQPTQEV